MFAFVIWDRQERRAFGARDYFGIKPMHYLQTVDGVYLASEKKALLPFAPAANAGDAGVDTANLSHYLTLQYVPEPGTLHQGISRIGSGECLTWTPGGGDARCAGGTGRSSGRRRSTTRSGSTTRSARRCGRACGMHMRSDVPVGAFLSSGIDCTAVVALSREFNPNILTFTVGYDVPGYSEIEVAQESARHLEVTTIPTKIGPQDMMDALPKIVWHLDDPVADPALVPLYFVAKKAAEHVTVVLSGEGADEFFGGYTIYREPLSLGAVQALPDPHAEGAAGDVQGHPAGRQGQELPGARHHADRGALLRQRADVHRGGEAARCCAATTPRCATPTSPPRSTPRRPSSTT